MNRNTDAFASLDHVQEFVDNILFLSNQPDYSDFFADVVNENLAHLCQCARQLINRAVVK